MAKKKTSSWLIGCGVGCLVLLLTGIALTAGCAIWFRGTTSGFEEAVAAREELEERFGDPADFVPSPDGSVAPERMEAFLAIRAATAESRERIGSFFSKIPLNEEEARELEELPRGERMRSIFGITTSAIGLAADIGDFYNDRNQAFAEQAMGLGEYSYLYVLAYYSWLDHSPSDGPGDEAEIDGDFRRTYRRVRRNLVAQIENQLAALEVRSSDAEAAAGSGPTREELAAEIEALEADRWRIPWQDGLPAATERAFAPYRERLEASYDPLTNPFELARMERRGRFSIEAN